MTTRYGEEIRAAREQRGLSQQELAKAIGTRQQTVDRIERGEVRNSRFLLPAREYLEIVRVTPGPGGPARARNEAATREALTPASGRTLPVFFGDVDGAREGYMVLRSAEMFAPRLAGMGDGPLYCVLVRSPVMEPAYEVDDQLYVLETTKPELGTDVLLRKAVGDGEIVIFARLTGIARDSWMVRQHNVRKKEFPVSRQEFPTCHRVVWIKKRMGTASRTGQI